MPVLGLLLLLSAQAVPASLATDEPLLVVLAPTGETREGLPVYARHPDAEAHEAVLQAGFSGRLLRVFRLEQQFLRLRDGRAVEPAYLLLSTNQGGFPRFGFWLDDERKDDVGYVDLHESSTLSGRFGAMDQIFPHELAHVIVRQLADSPPPGTGGANQVHAIGVRTDRVTAFSEGFAEAVQVLAVDDPDARPDTRALAADPMPPVRAAGRFAEYRRALEARWALAPPARLAFVFWFGKAEQAQRYHGVKANVFARETPIPARLLDRSDPYKAYLIENTLPGDPGAPVKSTPRLLSTEGVVAALFSDWLADAALQRPATSPGLFERFGVTGDGLTSEDHAWIKLMVVLADARPHDAASLIRGYVRTFPDERDAVARVAQGAGLTWPLPEAAEIWLANDALITGTTLYDQYRALPRVHTFDLNAASLVDLRSVDGVSPDLARAVMGGAPYGSVDELERVSGMTPRLLERFRRMAVEMTAVREANARGDIESIELMRIFRPVFVRAAAWILLASVVAAWLYRRVRETSRWRAAVNGFAAATIGLMGAWVLGAALETAQGPAVVTFVLVFVPLVVCGLPGACWQLVRHRTPREAARVVGAWAAACVPALLVTQPLF